MSSPTVHVARQVARDTDQLGTYLVAPGLGHLAMNAFLLRSREPVLVDAGIVNMAERTMAALEELIDPAEIRWIYLTHVDSDHVGCIDALLRRAPRARLVTTFLGMCKLSLTREIAPERILLLNPGQELDVGDRKLLVASPPCYDAPETTMLFDAKTRTLFSSDYFGAFVPSPVESAAEVPAPALHDGMTTFLAVDSPWVRSLRPEFLEQATRSVVELAPETVLSAHLAPARDLVDVLTANVRDARTAGPFTSPDQAAFEKLLNSPA